jgi:hypothetical protein
MSSWKGEFTDSQLKCMTETDCNIRVRLPLYLRYLWTPGYIGCDSRHSGYSCTRQLGHDGPHIAHDGESYATPGGVWE